MEGEIAVRVPETACFLSFFLPRGPRPRTYRHENLHCHEHLGWFPFLLMRRCYLQGPRLIGVPLHLEKICRDRAFLDIPEGFEQRLPPQSTPEAGIETDAVAE